MPYLGFPPHGWYDRPMAQTSEEQFLSYIAKGAESEAPQVYEDPPDTPEQNTEAVVFSDVAQESSKDVKEGVLDRLLDHKDKSDSAARALVGNILPQGETRSLQLKSVEKVSHPTLIEQTLRVAGRL